MCNAPLGENDLLARQGHIFCDMTSFFRRGSLPALGAHTETAPPDSDGRGARSRPSIRCRFEMC